MSSFVFVHPECVKWASSEEDGVNNEHPTCVPGAGRSYGFALTDVRSDKSDEEPHGSRVKAPPVPLEGRANCSHEAAELGTERNTFTKPIIAKHLPVVA